MQRSRAPFTRWDRTPAIDHLARAVLIPMLAAVLLGASTAPSLAAGVSPDQLTAAGWTCVRPLADPSREICAPPGRGLPPLPGTPGFADRGPSYELLVFAFATGDFLGVQHLLRPDIYLHGTPPCPQQPNGTFVYIPRNDTWSCFHST